MTGELAFEQVSVSVRSRTLVREVSFTVRPAEVVGLLGPNGAGKTTLLRTAYRARRPSAGRVLLDGEDIWQMRGKSVARRVAAVLQDAAGDFELTVFDVVAMGRTPHKRAFEADDEQDRNIVGAALWALDIAGMADVPFDRLSGGQKQRALIARALAQRTEVIVLDEPTNHLDLRHQHDALHVLRRTGATVLAALHDVNLAAAFCDRICVMDHGRVIGVGTPDEVLTADLLSAVYGVDVEVSHHPRIDAPQVTLLPRIPEQA